MRCVVRVRGESKKPKEGEMPTKDGVHYLDGRLLNEAIKVVVIGAGGSGSHMVADLAVLHQSMIDLGHPGGIDCTVIDFDHISQANVGRSRFYEADVGANKAQTIVNRVNACYGLNFKAISEKLEAGSRGFALSNADLVIGCVDTRESRRSILSILRSVRRYGRSVYWLDLGNGDVDGQVVLGEVGDIKGGRLPCVTDLFPEMLDNSLDPADAGPSCSRAEALTRQSAFVNKAASMHAISMLSMLFRYGQIEHHACFFSLKTGRVSVLACDPKGWEQRFGFSSTKAEPAAVGADGSELEDFDDNRPF